MKLYLVITEDRHTDDEYVAYSDLQEALSRARVEVRDCLANYPHRSERDLDTDIPSDWHFSARLEECFGVVVREIEMPR